MNFKQQSLRDFQNQHKAGKHPIQTQPRNKVVKPHKARKDTRLPDKSRFLVEYNANTQTWTGTLNVEGMNFTDTSGAVFHLLHKLDKQYRKWLKTRPDNCADSVKKI
jgi:hypothetical protein